MKNLNETFTDEEYMEMKLIKDGSGENWHDFIIKLIRCDVAHNIKTDDSDPHPYTEYGTREYNETIIPANGRVRLTKAAGETIEWRIKDE